MTAEQSTTAPAPQPPTVVHQPILLTPGCHAFVSIGDGTTAINRETANKMKAELIDRFPGVTFTLVNGRLDAVMRPEDHQ